MSNELFKLGGLVISGYQEKDKSCKGNKVWSEEKGRCVQKEKEGKEDKPCKCVKYSPRGCNEGDSSPLNQRGECPDNYSK